MKVLNQYFNNPNSTKMRLVYILSTTLFSIIFFQANSQTPISLPGPTTTCPSGEFAGHHHTPTPGWIQNKIRTLEESKSSGNSCGSIEVTYIGFSPEAQTVFQTAVDIWEALIQTNVTIQVQANWTVLDDGVLGSAGPNTIWSGFSGAPEDHWYPSALADQLHGSDLDPGEPDINANFNSDFDWYLGTDGNPPGNQYDLLSVVLHELGHGLGFISTKDYDNGNGTLGFDGTPYTYDTFLTLGPNGSLLLDITDPMDLGDAFTSNNVYTNSSSAVDSLGGVFPRHYAPSDYAGGSSISHWNESTFGLGNINSLMTPQIGPGEAILNPGPITLGLFADIGWIICDGSEIPCTAQDLSLEGAAAICPGVTTEVDLVSVNTIPLGGGAGIRFNNNNDVNIILFGVSFPYVFDNDLNGVLTGNGMNPFEGVFDLTTFVYSDENSPGSSICSESDNPIIINFLSSDDPDCFVPECTAEDLLLTGPSAVCPAELTSVDVINPNTIPDGGGQGIRFFNGSDVNIILSNIDFPYSFDNDLNGLLSANDFDPFVGEFDLTTFVYTDPANVGSSICDESLVAVEINFRDENDPECIVDLCLAQNLDLEGPDAICPGETTTVDVSAPNEVPLNGGQGILFTNGSDVNIVLTNVDFSYTFDNDLNGVLSANSMDPFEGNFTLTTVVYEDPLDAVNTICSESAQSIEVDFLTKEDAPCLPSPCLEWSQPEQGEGWTNFNDQFGGAPCDPGSGCPVFEITAFEAWAGEAYAMDNIQEGGTYTFSICNGPGAEAWEPDFTIIAPSGEVDAFGADDGCSITWTATESGTYLIVINEAGNCGGSNQINNGYPSITCEGDNVSCPIVCDAGELESQDGNTLCPGFSASILNTAGLAGVNFPNEGGYRLKVEIGDNVYYAETLDPQFGFVINNDLFGVVSGQGDDPLVGVATLTAETYEDAGDPDGSICDSSEELSFEFLSEDDPDCSLGLNEFITYGEWTLYPNPAVESFAIEFNAHKAGSAIIQILDVQGRELKSLNYNLSPGKMNITLDVNDLAQGVYQVILNISGSIDSKPLVISKN